MIKENIRKALFIELHKVIEKLATNVIEGINEGDISYPPGVELTNSEKKALKTLSLSNDAKSGLKKLVLDACSYPSFHLFSLLDGVADPESEEIEEWFGLSFCEKNEDEEMMHDDFFESYWDYKEAPDEKES